jgi:hypothetical protein
MFRQELPPERGIFPPPAQDTYSRTFGTAPVHYLCSSALDNNRADSDTDSAAKCVHLSTVRRGMFRPVLPHERETLPLRPLSAAH